MDLTTLNASSKLEEIALPIDMQFNNGNLLAIVVYSMLLVFSSFGNIYVLITIYRIYKRHRKLTSMYLLLLHLSVADLLVTFLMMPIEIAWNITVSWMAGDLLCRLLSFCRIFGLYLSGFVLMCISIDRYYAIVHPLSFAHAVSRCRKMVNFAWLASALASFPQVFIFHVESHPVFEFYEQCVTFNSFPSPQMEMAYRFFGFSLLYGLPLVTILGCYLCILWEIWGQHSIARHDTLQRSNNKVLGRAKSRTLKMTVVIVSTFCLCWTPYNIICLWYWLDEQSAQEVDQRVQKILFLFACTNSCMNPLIYGLFHFQRSPSGHRRGTLGTSQTVFVRRNNETTQNN